jgi:uncharacterized protein (UPF0303 family)
MSVLMVLIHREKKNHLKTALTELEHNETYLQRKTATFKRVCITSTGMKLKLPATETNFLAPWGFVIGRFYWNIYRIK